ncbi:MAG TPA: YoaK family protein [Edaphobacter sp.]
MADEQMPRMEGTEDAEQQAVHLASRLTNSALLALAGGFLDGFTYVGHGHVFANAMTGNVVLLGINCFSGSVRQGLRHLPAIVMFLLGVTVAKMLETPTMTRLLRHTHLAAILIQMSVLTGLALLPAGTPDMWFTTLIAFSASVQVESFRKVNGRSFNSTFTTGNLRTFAESFFAWAFAGGGDEARGAAWDFAVICFCFFAGAACGGVATMKLGNRALWFDIALLAIVVARVYPRRPVARV